MQGHRYGTRRSRRARRTRALAATVILVGALALTGCAVTRTRWTGTGDGGIAVTISSPADGAVDQPASTEISYRVSGAAGDPAQATVSVRLTDASGNPVDGALRPDGSSWVPSRQLDFGTRYTARVTVTLGGASASSSSIAFTTMNTPANTVQVHSFIGDGQVLGVGAPLVLQFDRPVADDHRVAIQRRLFVSAAPEQDGAWNWFSASEVHYRPRRYWQTGTRISLRALLGGLPMGNGEYGGADLTVDASVETSALSIVIDDATESLTVTRDGRVLRTIPASLGKASTPSSSGNMVIMTIAKQEIFDSATFGVPPTAPGGYRETVYYPLRLTWSGEYIHAAPWSLGQQGRYDVSHGCTNISPWDAQWLYGIAHVGDPVTVEHTGTPLNWGNGWTDWNVGWDRYLKGSAIPYAPPTGTRGTPVPSAL